MTNHRKFLLGLGMSGVLLAQQAPAPITLKPSDKTQAYYQYSLGHLYGEMAAQAGYRGDYVNKAIDNLRAALKLDPNASFIAEELSDLYLQSGRLNDAVKESEAALAANPNDLNARRVLGRIYTRLIGDSQQGRIDKAMLDRAIDQYQKIADKAPKDADNWLMLGRLLKVAQNSAQAEIAYQKALELNPDNEDALTGLAMVYADLGDTKKSSEFLQRVVSKNPSLRTLTALAASYEQMRDYPHAAETLERALQLSPGNTELKKALAKTMVLADRNADALKIYEELVADDAKDAESWLRISQIYRQNRNWEKAAAASAKAKEAEPASLEVRYNEVNLLDAQGKPAEAIRVMKDVLAGTTRKSYNQGEKANRALFLERLAQLYRGNNQTAEAITAYREVADLDASVAARMSAQIVQTYLQANDTKQAITEADAAIKLYPEDRLLKAVRASALSAAGRTDEAVSGLKALLDGKNDREMHLALAQVYEKAKRFDDQERSLAAAEKLSANQEERVQVIFQRGALLEKRKQFDQAEVQFREVLKLEPDNASALNYLGYMLADRNVRLAEAEKMIARALELEPDNSAFLDSMGWVYYRQGKLPEAERTLLRALERFDKDPTMHDHLGDVYLQMGRVKEAITQWERSLKEYEAAAATDRDPAEVAKVQQKLESARVRLAKETGRK